MAFTLKLTSDSVVYRSVLNTDQTIAALPNFTAYGGFPTDTLINTMKRLIDAQALLQGEIDALGSIPDFSAITQTQATQAGALTTLSERLGSVESNPVGIQTIAFNVMAGDLVLVITLLTGQTFTSSPLDLPQDVFVQPTEPSGTYRLWIQTDGSGNAVGFKGPEGTL